jgi:predicted esterase
MLRDLADDLVCYATGRRVDAMRQIGFWLHGCGGDEAMEAVFDLALRRHGYAALPGVNGAWKGIGNWDD